MEGWSYFSEYNGEGEIDHSIEMRGFGEIRGSLKDWREKQPLYTLILDLS